MTYGGYGEGFRTQKALLDVVRYEEVERLIHQIMDLKNEDDFAFPMYAKHEDRELTQEEVWAKAIDFAAEILDGRLSVLCQD